MNWQKRHPAESPFPMASSSAISSSPQSAVRKQERSATRHLSWARVPAQAK
ncbi:hypothetical protein C2845_PM11G06830 [Panicum miliaceum]|uniref:Uncharacterized protein n=1 Tax=Panicum miliaceum TaxID=4540 RepID=A0A3L6RUL7_PANMI|nr:hypothetical protein C2845_PM11G06830 [Panicum miliaceum]